MKEREELELILKLIGKYNLPLSPILEYAVKEKMEEYPEEEQITAFVNEESAEDGYIPDKVFNSSFLPQSYDIKWFCLSVLACLEELMDNRTYQILYDTLNGEPRSSIAKKQGLTQERIRQIVTKAIKQAKELFIEQCNNFEKEKEDNARLNVQLNLMREKMVRLEALSPKEELPLQKDSNEELDAELVKLLETPIKLTNLPVRAVNILLFMKINNFVDIPQIESKTKLLEERNSGMKTVHDVSCILEDFHLTFGMSYTEIVNALRAHDWYAAKRKWIKGSKTKEETNVAPHFSTAEKIQNEVEKVKSDETTIVLTEEIIEAARTPNGGFTKSQLAAIGVAWPPPQDWINEKVGTTITLSQLEEFKHIEYVVNSSSQSYNVKGSKTYKNVATSLDDMKKMEAILQAMTHFYIPATPYDIARTISRTAWGGNIVREEIVETFLKLLPEVEYVKRGKYILKSRNKSTSDQSTSVPTDTKNVSNTSDDKRIGYTVRLFPSQLKGEIVRVKKDAKGIKKIVVKTTNGDIVEVDDLPYLYEVLKRK